MVYPFLALEKIEELWKPIYKTFFPKGLEDPELALMKISVEKKNDQALLLAR